MMRYTLFILIFYLFMVLIYPPLNINVHLTRSVLSKPGVQILGLWDFGKTFDVVVDGNYLYLAAGAQVRVYDISTEDKLLALAWKQVHAFPGGEPWGVGTYKEVTPPVKILHTEGFVEGLYIDGNYLYIANSKGLVIADISKPENSYIVSILELGKTDGARKYGRCRDVVVRGKYAYVAFPNPYEPGIKIIDISDKSSPTIVSEIDFRDVRRIDLSGNYLYVPRWEELVIIDVTNPVEPRVVGNWSLPKELASGHSGFSSVAAKGNYVFLINYHRGVHVIDVSDPTKPKEICRMIDTKGSTYNYNDIKIFGNYAFISQRYQGFDIVNITDPRNIAVVKDVWILPGYEEGIFVASLSYGNFVFLSANTLGLGVVDVTDMSNPKKVVVIPTPGGGDSIAVKDRYVFIGTHNEGVWVIDVSDPTNPRHIALVKNAGRNTGIAIKDNYLFVAGCWADLSVIDISDPENPKLVVWDYGPSVSGNIVIHDDFLYIGGLKIYNISDPKNPKLIFDKSLGLGSGAGVYAMYKDRYLLGGGDKGFFIIDVSNKNDPTIIASIPEISLYNGLGDGHLIKVVGNIAFVSSEAGHLYAVDLSDVKNPKIIGSVKAGGSALAVLGNIAYTINRVAVWGFYAVNISNPKEMKIVDELYTISSNDIVAGDKYLYTSSGHVILPIGGVEPPLTVFLVEVHVSKTSAIISWQTNKEADSLVKYGKISGKYEYQKYDPTLTKHHSIRLDNLEANTTYYFVVVSSTKGETAQSPEMNFKTLEEDFNSLVLEIKKGWNLISIPISLGDQYTAKDLANYLGDGCKLIAMWDSSKQKFMTYIPGFSSEEYNFQIKPEYGYFIYANEEFSIELNGTFIKIDNIELKKGWNLVGWDREEITAKEIAQSVGKECKLLAKWNSEEQKYIVYIPEFSSEDYNFKLRRGEVVLIYMNENKEWAKP